MVGIGCVRESVFVMLQEGGSRYFFLASRESFVFHCGTCINFVVFMVIFCNFRFSPFVCVGVFKVVIIVAGCFPTLTQYRVLVAFKVVIIVAGACF